MLGHSIIIVLVVWRWNFALVARHAVQKLYERPTGKGQLFSGKVVKVLLPGGEQITREECVHVSNRALR